MFRAYIALFAPIQFGFWLVEVFINFGLAKSWKWQTFGLRDKILYRPVFYYFVMIFNLLARFSWLIVIIWDVNDYPLLGKPFIFGTMLMLFDFMRRFLWGFIRAENEQLNNPEGFRKVLEIPEVSLEEYDDKAEELMYVSTFKRVFTETSGISLSPNFKAA